MSHSPFLESTKFYILLALAEGPSHGYAIRDQIIGDTLGAYVPDSLLYAVLKVMARDGLIEPMPGMQLGKRHPYQLTDRGRRRLELEARTLKRATRLAQERLRSRG